jgi:membrane fusion protein (multidrug efflux system)
MEQHTTNQAPDRETLQDLKEEYQRQRKAWKKANRRAGWPLYLLIGILAAAIAFSGFLLYQKTISGAAVAEEGSLVIPVTGIAVSRAAMVETYKGNGDVAAASSVDVYADTASGKVTDIVAEPGDMVARDDIIMWIDPSRPGQTYAQSPVRSPIAGTVTAVNASVGSLVSAQMPVATVGDLSNLEVVTYIPEKFVTSVRLGQQARISLISWEEGDFLSGRVSEVSPVVDPNSRTLKTVIALDSAAASRRGVRAGMFVKISMVTRTWENVLTLPGSAIIERFDDQFVYIIEEDENDLRVRRRDIVSDLRIDGVARIVSGLEEGDLVVLKGNNLVEDQSAVRIVSEE